MSFRLAEVRALVGNTPASKNNPGPVRIELTSNAFFDQEMYTMFSLNFLNTLDHDEIRQVEIVFSLLDEDLPGKGDEPGSSSNAYPPPTASSPIKFNQVYLVNGIPHWPQDIAHKSTPESVLIKSMPNPQENVALGGGKLGETEKAEEDVKVMTLSGGFSSQGIGSVRWYLQSDGGPLPAAIPLVVVTRAKDPVTQGFNVRIGVNSDETTITTMGTTHSRDIQHWAINGLISSSVVAAESFMYQNTFSFPLVGEYCPEALAPFFKKPGRIVGLRMHR